MLAALPIPAVNAEEPPEGMVLVPAGELLMGNPSGRGDSGEHPQRIVSLGAVYMDAHEVTNAEYKAFLDATGYSGRNDADDNYLKHWENGSHPPDRGNHPVIRVTIQTRRLLPSGPESVCRRRRNGNMCAARGRQPCTLLATA
jgi:formylglycine-generating enzyme required for sulfatase activity